MLALDSGDKIRGDAAAATKVDYTIHGLDNNAVKQLADGQLANSIDDLFTADSVDIVTSIILVNTDTSARAVNLYLTPSGGTERRLIPKDLSLGIGYCLITDGSKLSVYDVNGSLIQATTALAHKDSHDPSGSDPLDTAAAGEIVGIAAAAEGSAETFARSDHTHQVQASIADNHVVTIDHVTPADNDYAKFTANGLEGRSKAETLSDLNVADGADVTGSNTPQAHKTTHQNGGGDEVSVTGLSGLLADDQHVLDAEAVSAVEAAGLTFAEDKGITLDISLADGSWNAILQVTGTAGAILAYGEAVYLAVADTKWEKARGNAEATISPMTGIVCVAGNEDAAITVLIIGSVRADAAFPALTVGAPVFIDPDTAGDVSSTELTTGEFQKAIGWATTANTVMVTGNPDWVKVG